MAKHSLENSRKSRADDKARGCPARHRSTVHRILELQDQSAVKPIKLGKPCKCSTGDALALAATVSQLSKKEAFQNLAKIMAKNSSLTPPIVIPSMRATYGVFKVPTKVRENSIHNMGNFINIFIRRFLTG